MEGQGQRINEVDIVLLKEAMPRMEGKIDSILMTLHGDSKACGMKTKVELNSRAISVLRWLYGIQAVALMGAVAKFLIC